MVEALWARILVLILVWSMWYQPCGPRISEPLLPSLDMLRYPESVAFGAQNFGGLLGSMRATYGPDHPANAAQSSVFRAAFWKWPSDGADM